MDAREQAPDTDGVSSSGYADCYSDLAITPHAMRGGAEPGSCELTA
jgi:hypothetical protein